MHISPAIERDTQSLDHAVNSLHKNEKRNIYMANNETKIPCRNGATTIVSDTFAVFGELQVGPPIPVENPEKWHARELDEAATCKRYDATPGELVELQQRHEFPKPIRQTHTPGWGLRRSTVKNFWSIEKLDAWDASIRQLAARTPRK